MFTLLSVEFSANGQILQLIYRHPVTVTECATKEEITVTYSVTLAKGVIASAYQWQAKPYGKLTAFENIDPKIIPSAATRI